MKWFHNIAISVFVKKGDDLDKVRLAVCSLLPFSLEERKLRLESEDVEVSDGKMSILRLSIMRDSDTTSFFRHLADLLGKDQIELVKKQKDRLHEDEGAFNFFIRLDKKSWIFDRKAVLTDSGDCIHIILTLAVFPRKLEIADALIEKVFS